MNTTTSTGFVYHADYLKHDTGVHPETAERLRVIIRELEEKGIAEKLRRIVPVKVSKEQLRHVHTPEYIGEVEAMCRRGGGALDLDTPLCEATYEIAMLAAGGVTKAVDEVMDKSNSLKRKRTRGGIC